MYDCWHSVGGTPGNAVWRTTCDLWDLVAIETLNQRRLAIHRRSSTALLAVVVVAPRIHLTKRPKCEVSSVCIVLSQQTYGYSAHLQCMVLRWQYSVLWIADCTSSTTFQASYTGIKLYCMWAEPQGCEQLGQCGYPAITLNCISNTQMLCHCATNSTVSK